MSTSPLVRVPAVVVVVVNSINEFFSFSAGMTLRITVMLFRWILAMHMFTVRTRLSLLSWFTFYSIFRSLPFSTLIIDIAEHPRNITIFLVFSCMFNSMSYLARIQFIVIRAGSLHRVETNSFNAQQSNSISIETDLQSKLTTENMIIYFVVGRFSWATESWWIQLNVWMP